MKYEEKTRIENNLSPRMLNDMINDVDGGDCVVIVLYTAVHPHHHCSRYSVAVQTGPVTAGTICDSRMILSVVTICSGQLHHHHHHHQSDS